jgi:ion channel
VSRPTTLTERPVHTPTVSRRAVVGAVARPVLTATAFTVAYYLLPVDRRLTGWTLAAFAGGLFLVVVVLVWQIRVIMRSRWPTLQGVQALAITIPLYLLTFANVYYLVAQNVTGSFTAALTRTDALYFTVTVFATVGFGDITPVTEAARVLVTAQMIGNLLLIGVALRVVLTAVQHVRRQREQTPPHSDQ